jgi:hypothetical protein
MAKQLAHEKLFGSDLTIDENIIIEKPFGWFFALSENFGCNGLIVDRDNGHVFALGSAYAPERDFMAYEAGFKYDFYDLVILSVRDIPQTVSLLVKLNMTYVIPEEENGIIWRIPQRYSPAQIQLALNSLPFTISNQGFYFHFETFQEIDKADCCTYQLIGHYQENR